MTINMAHKKGKEFKQKYYLSNRQLQRILSLELIVARRFIKCVLGERGIEAKNRLKVDIQCDFV